MHYLFIIHALIGYNMYINNDVFIILVGPDKCFDKLCLEDACNELCKIDFPSVAIKLL